MSKKLGNGGSVSATARLKQDYLRLKKDPVPYVTAEPLPANILEWHYVVEGPEQSPYKGGYYHGKLVFPAEFPFKPPSIYMITPNGRFKTNTRLCLSISDYHPDTWNPAWNVGTILTGLLSFMLEKSPTFGSIETSDYEKRQFAQQSLEFNLKDKIFCELFPDLAEKLKAEIQLRKDLENQQISSSANLESRVSGGWNGQRIGVDNPGVFANIAVLCAFGVFAYIVKFVLRSLSID